MPVALKSSTPRSTEAGSVPVKYGLKVEGSTFAPWTTICWALAGAAQFNPHRLRATARRTPTYPRIQSIWPIAPVRADAAGHLRRRFSVILLAPPARLTAPLAGGAAYAAALCPVRRAAIGKINGVLQSLLA